MERICFERRKAPRRKPRRKASRGRRPGFVELALTQSEVAAVMTVRGYPMSQSAVDHTEQRALSKLRKDPVLAILFSDLARVFRPGSHYRFLKRPSDAAHAAAIP